MIQSHPMASKRYGKVKETVEDLYKSRKKAEDGVVANIDIVLL